jgi:hypothetical protein
VVLTLVDGANSTPVFTSGGLIRRMIQLAVPSETALQSRARGGIQGHVRTGRRACAGSEEATRRQAYAQRRAGEEGAHFASAARRARLA